MCWCHCPWFYRALPACLAFLTFCEFICGIIRIAVFFSLDTEKEKNSFSSKLVAGFFIDWIGSLTAALMGFLVGVSLVILAIKILVVCCRDKRTSDNSTSGVLRALWRNKPLHRLIALDCNCSWYKVRPKLRFFVRFAFLLSCFLLRITAISLYLSSENGDGRGNRLAIISAVSIIFLAFIFLLDLYHYAVWWCYTPSTDTRCYFRSKKHIRYLPYHMVGDLRNEFVRGDEPCQIEPCTNRRLEHIVVFHSSSYKPQARWTDVVKNGNGSTKQPLYIGFHKTTPEAAANIAHSDFILSVTGLLGPGVYFARSLEGTIGKAHSTGAWFIAEIDMGKVFIIHRRFIVPEKNNRSYNPGIHRYVANGNWHAKYDTCYLVHEHDDRDEFCVKDPASQIVKWVVVVDRPFDHKVRQYGLDTEFDSTWCNCV